MCILGKKKKIERPQRIIDSSCASTVKKKKIQVQTVGDRTCDRTYKRRSEITGITQPTSAWSWCTALIESGWKSISLPLSLSVSVSLCPSVSHRHTNTLHSLSPDVISDERVLKSTLVVFKNNFLSFFVISCFWNIWSDAFELGKLSNSVILYSNTVMVYNAIRTFYKLFFFSLLFLI